LKNDFFLRPFLTRPLVTVILFYVGGLYTGRTISIDPFFSFTLLSLFTCLLLILFFSFRNKFPYLLITIFFPLGLFLSQAYIFQFNVKHNISHYAVGESVTVEGMVLNREDVGPEKKLTIASEKVLIEGESSIVKGRLLLILESGGKDIVPGQRIRFMAKLRKPRNFGNPGNFDYERYLRERGVYATSYLKDDLLLAIIGESHSIWESIISYRRMISEAIEESTIKRSRGIITAITIGDRGYIEESLMTAFRKAGVAHLLAISGLHMGIVAFFFFRIFSWLLSRSERILLYNLAGKGAALLTLFPLSVYLIASGMATSAVRAYIMVLVFLFSVIMERESHIYNTIALAALIILFIWPLALFEVGFQLSFIAVLSIVYLVPRLEKLLKVGVSRGQASWKDKVASFAIVSFAASLGTAPLTAYYFTEVSFFAVISNLIVVPLGGFIAVPLSSLALFLSMISLDMAKLLFWAASFVMEIPVALSCTISSIPYASALVVPPTIYEVFLYYILLFLLFSSVRKVVISSMLLIPTFFIVTEYSGPGHSEGMGELTVTFISVGQGESAFIRFPKGKTMLIDGGGFYDNSFDVGRNVLRPFLLSQGVRDLDYVVITHPHPDHMYGLLHVVSEFVVGDLWINGMPPIDDIYKEILSTAEKRGIEQKVISDLTPDIEIEGVTIHFLHPKVPEFIRYKSGKDINNGSIVMKLTYGEKSFLFTGDLEKEGEKRLLSAKDDLKSVVLKVGHHGSLNSSTEDFVSAVSPEYALFSVGHNNRFRFPKEKVVSRFKDRGSRIFRTDISGAVTFITDGSKIRIKTFR